jgi:hypothetical protein
MTESFLYISRTRLEYRHDVRHAYIGNWPQPTVYGVQGSLARYYGSKEPPVASTLDQIVAAVAG